MRTLVLLVLCALALFSGAKMNTAAADVSDAEKARIDAWIVANNLNQYGDSADTMYLGGTPLFNERTGEVTDRYVYIVSKNANRPWN